MAIQPGDRIPEVTLTTMAADGPRAIAAAEVFDGRTVVLFAVPGAFTPTCSDEHLPGFVTRLDELRGHGADRVACIAVNDAYVMAAWAKARGVPPGILMLADGNGEFTRAMGLEADLGRFGMGLRSRRYAAVVVDQVVQWLEAEPGGGVTVSGADAVLDYLGRRSAAGG
jgi:peroxiredoxin